MQPQQRRPPAVENIQRGSRPWIDLEQECLFARHQEIRRGDSLEGECPAHPLDRRCYLPRGRGGEGCGAHRAAIAPEISPGRCGPLFAESEHARVPAITGEQSRDRTSRDALLKVETGVALAQPAWRNMAAAGATDLLDEPARVPSGPRGDGSRMRHAKPRKLGEEDLRRLDPGDGGGVIADDRPALSDSPQQVRPVLEAGAINESAHRGGSSFGQGVERAQQTARAESAGDVASQLAAGMRRSQRVGVGEEVRHQRRETGASRRLRQRPPRDRRD